MPLSQVVIIKVASSKTCHKKSCHTSKAQIQSKPYVKYIITGKIEYFIYFFLAVLTPMEGNGEAPSYGGGGDDGSDDCTDDEAVCDTLSDKEGEQGRSISLEVQRERLEDSPTKK